MGVLAYMLPSLEHQYELRFPLPVAVLDLPHGCKHVGANRHGPAALPSKYGAKHITRQLAVSKPNADPPLVEPTNNGPRVWTEGRSFVTWAQGLQ